MEARREPMTYPDPTTDAEVVSSGDDVGRSGDGSGTELAERDSLVDDERAADFRDRWGQIQARFVDEPERSVQEADRLVSEVIRDLQDSFTAQREGLEGQWHGGGEASTEDLRVALQGYRSFFVRLLGA